MIALTLSEIFNGVIWKLLPDNNRKLIAIEIRNAENRQTVFSVLNYETGETLLKEHHVEESWFVALSHVHNNLVFITGYESESSPVSKGITAIDIDTKGTRWQKFNYSFYDAWNEGIRVYNPNINPRKFEWLNYETGEVIYLSNPTPLNNQIRFPSFTTIKALPEVIQSKMVIGDVLSLDHQELNINSFHESFDGNMRLRILITSANYIVLDEILSDRIQKQQLETFFLVKDHLFYIRNSNQIVSYNLV